MEQILIARQRECEELKECMASERSEFVTVCGRRRIGKTYLIDRFFNNTFDFYFVGVHTAKTVVQLRNFAKAIRNYSGKAPKAFKDWYDAFDALEEYLESLPQARKRLYS